MAARSTRRRVTWQWRMHPVSVAPRITHGDVAIFPNGEGTPSTYFDDWAISLYDYCAYDSGGNLYVSAHDGPPDIIGELPSGSGSFSNITLTEDIGPVSMQWVGSSLVVSSFANVQSKFGPQPIYDN